jgi:hypothetical protein
VNSLLLDRKAKDFAAENAIVLAGKVALVHAKTTINIPFSFGDFRT